MLFVKVFDPLHFGPQRRSLISCVVAYCKIIITSVCSVMKSCQFVPPLSAVQHNPPLQLFNANKSEKTYYNTETSLHTVYVTFFMID